MVALLIQMAAGRQGSSSNNNNNTDNDNTFGTRRKAAGFVSQWASSSHKRALRVVKLAGRKQAIDGKQQSGGLLSATAAAHKIFVVAHRRCGAAGLEISEKKEQDELFIWTL